LEVRVDKFRDTLNLLKPAIPKKTAIPILKSVLLDDGKAIATDLQTSVVIDLPEADGKCLVPHAEVSELLKFVPGNEKLTIEWAKKSINLSWDGGKAAYPAADPADYPKAIPDEKSMVEKDVDGTILVKALTSMAPYAAKEETRAVLAGVSLYLGEKVQAAAGDGFRMVVDDLPLSYPAQHTIIVPNGAIPVIAHVWDKTSPVAALAASLVQQVTAKRTLNLALGGGKENAAPTWASLQFGKSMVIFKLIQGNSPDFKALIPVPTKKVQVMAPDFETAVLRVKEIAKENSGIVRLVWTETELTVSAKSEEKGESEATIPASAMDGPGHIALNVSYLVEYLKGKGSFVTFGVTNDSSPVLFQYPRTPATVVMPMMVQW
jgi:DNA polymerase-3 subunit beta